MIQIIHGKKGSGKTKKILDMANAAVDQHKGDVIFLDDDNRYMFDLRHEVRFVNAGEFGSDSPEMFFGFLCGMLSSNYDLSLIAVDAFKKLVKTDMFSDEMRDFFEQVDRLSERHGCNFVFSISSLKEDVPEFIAKYAMN